MCGIFGYAGNDPKKLNIDKLNILGILNETRGTDSCGLSLDGDILKGVNTLSKYRDFGAFYRIENPIVVPTAIGHTRKSTIGAHTKDNAHPFGFGSIDIKGLDHDAYEFIGVHNGSLLNHSEFAKKRKLDLTKNANVTTKNSITGGEKTLVQNVNKIDSELLLESLYKDNNFSVLSEYNGAAALIWSDLNESNTVYFYHGKSKSKKDETTEIEERPLYYWKESNNSIYVSSIEDSLYIIGGDIDDVKEFDHNTVYKVTNGDIDNAEKTIINRSNNYQKDNYSNPYACGYDYSSKSDDYKNKVNSAVGKTYQKNKAITSTDYYPKLGTTERLLLNLKNPINDNLLSEDYDVCQTIKGASVQMKQLRYFRNGHKINGIYAHIENYGFHFLSYTKLGAVEAVKQYQDKQFSNGVFFNKNSKNNIKNYDVPFSKDLVEKNISSFFHYMHDGIRYKTELDWKSVCADSTSLKRFGIIELSMCAAHPIIDVSKSPNSNKSVYFKGELCNGIFIMLGSKKKYVFKDGKVTEISFLPQHVPDALKNTNKTVYTLDSAISFLENASKLDEEASEKIDNLNDIVNDLEQETKLNNIILNNFHENFDKFPEVIRHLKKFDKKYKKAQIALEILEDFIEGCNRIVELDKEEEINNKKRN